MHASRCVLLRSGAPSASARPRRFAWALAGLLGTSGGLCGPVHADPGDAAPAARAGASPGRPRARDLGIPFEGTPGPLNALTDLPEVEVGHTTLVRGSGPHAVRTGVTAIFPRGRDRAVRSVAAIADQNGNGELTGSHWVRESGYLESPIVLTNTHSVGIAHAAVIRWGQAHHPDAAARADLYALPVVGETYDGLLSDIRARTVREEDVLAALDGARRGPIPEGNVGGGTGMVCAEWKGGIGTASRVVALPAGRFTVGALVQANYGRRADLRIAGVPVGQEIRDLLPVRGTPSPSPSPPVSGARDKDGSILVVLGTDAPLLPSQLARLVRRASLGLGRTGAIAYNSSGDLFIAFGRAEPAPDARGLQSFTVLANEAIDPLLQAAVQATEEAIANALIAAETMTGKDGVTVYALPHDRLRAVLRRYRPGP